MRFTRGGNTTADGLVLRGLHFAIVDEADSIFIDEARTPLILSSKGEQPLNVEVLRQALELANALVRDQDWFVVERDRSIHITENGRARIAELARDLWGVWHSQRAREEVTTRALSAIHLFERDKHYIVVEGKVQIVDEFTGRVMPDRTWEQGLHQMIECKEGCELTGQNRTIARITYQRFFRRYQKLCGMTGTAREVARELWEVYRLPVVRIPTRKPIKRTGEPIQLFETCEQKWRAVADDVKTIHEKNDRPILIGTRSVEASEILSRQLASLGLPHEVLNARNDAQEAEIVSHAGKIGKIMVSTNMAGRGTDIKLAQGVEALGGLHVILTEFHESTRIDRQLFGRSGRQGEAGSFAPYASFEDELFRLHVPILARLVLYQWRHGRRRSYRTGQLLVYIAQFAAERHNKRTRNQTLKYDKRLNKMLAFSSTE